MKKVTLVLLILIMAAAAFTGCGNTENDSQEDAYSAESATPAEIADYLEANITFDDYMDILDGDIFYSLYDLPEDVVKDACVYVSTGATAEEIAVVSAYDQEGADKIHAAFEARVEAQKLGFENYVPAELDKLGSPVYYQINNAMILIICKDTEEAQRAIDGCIETLIAGEE